jgi:IS5 family transposase
MALALNNYECDLKVVRDFQEQYETISGILDLNPGILAAYHADLARLGASSGRESSYSSEQIMRMELVKRMEDLSYRDTIVRVASDVFFRNFTRINSGPVMNFTALEMACKRIRPETWDRINDQLCAYARKRHGLAGERLRVDSTVCESNIHYPTDTSLLWDSYRVMARLMRQGSKYDRRLDLGFRFHEKKIKRLYTFIATHHLRKKAADQRSVKKAMRILIQRTEDAWRKAVRFVEAGQGTGSLEAMAVVDELHRLQPLVLTVIRCTQRAQAGEKVPAADRIFSIFEPHTELLKRGKTHKPNEFGHLVTLGQTAEKFISFYKVEECSRHDRELGDEALGEHRRKFGKYPEQFTADKNYYGGPDHVRKWEERIDEYSVAKKGRRTAAETVREHRPVFQLLQRFRAGCEGSISFLKRAFGLYRCLNRGFKSFAAAIGNMVFCHNLVVLSRL